MLRHYFRVAVRNLARQKVLTVINISGLSLGLACFCVILLFAALAAVVIAWLTIGMQAWRAARINPADNLRTE